MKLNLFNVHHMHLVFESYFITTMGVTKGGKGDTIPGTGNHYGDAQWLRGSLKILNAMHLLPKDLRFKKWGAKRASWPGRHITSLCPWWQQCLKKFIETHFDKNRNPHRI